MIGFVLAGGHLVGGILQAIYSDDWDDFIGSDADTIRRSMIASAVSHVLHVIAQLLYCLIASYV